MTAALFGAPGGAPGSQYAATPIAQDRLIRKEVSLGLIREIIPPVSHIGLQIAPFKEVPTDDVIFEYAKGLADGLAPARAEDAESELAQKDDSVLGQGRASVIDWSLKDHYTPSDVTRFREYLRVAEAVRDNQAIDLTFMGGMQADFMARVARDTARRSRKIYNRLEWLTMTALSTGAIAYNDGKIKFLVDYQRPGAQQGQAPASGVYGSTTHDPINDVLKIQQYMMDRYGVRMKNALCSQQYLDSLINSDRFIARSGLVTQPGSTKVDPAYLFDGWGPDAAVAIVAKATGVTFTPYDSVYRTRPIGSTVTTNTRFWPSNRVLFMPGEEDITEFDDTGLGLGKMLTSPHPAGDWTPGFYEWEHDYGVDPWGLDKGTGLKAFPIFPHMELTYTMDVNFAAA